MGKIIKIVSLSIFFVLLTLILVLSFLGIETRKFNILIENKIKETNFVNLELDKIKFKLDLREISLFLETKNTNLKYRNTNIPAKNIKAYIDFLSLFKSSPKIKKVNLSLDQFNIEDSKEIISVLKPSNLKSFLRNNVINGKVDSEFEFFFKENNKLQNFIAKGKVSNFDTKILKNLILRETSFNFFLDKTDVLIKNINGEFNGIKISEGDIVANLEPKLIINSNFISNIKNFDNTIKDYIKKTFNLNFVENIDNLNVSLNNTLSLNFDSTYKLENYSLGIKGEINNAKINLSKSILNPLSKEMINDFIIKNSKIETKLDSKHFKGTLIGKYSTDGSNFLKFDLKNEISKNLTKLNAEFEYDQIFDLNVIGYKKNKGITSRVTFELKKDKDIIELSDFNYSEAKNLISLKKVKFKKNDFLSLDKISVKTYLNEKKNNDFTINYGKKIIVKGEIFDASSLGKFFKSKSQNNFLKNITKNIEIDFSKINAPLTEKLSNFKLIGKLQKGKFVKISSKGDFGDNKFLDISMKSNNSKKYLEIYSDLPQPLLAQYNFFKGLSGGKLFFSSIIEKDNSSSKLTIENFKVVNAPGLIKLLSLADLGGLADLAEGDGISFDILEISMSNKNNFLKINEILAMGPSLSVLMEGYIDQKNLTSLRGTLVPAKNLNKLISKIPVIGNIVIPKELGEGLFGISFKMKGLPGEIKTSINPIRTVTPRFIQKIIDKKQSK